MQSRLTIAVTIFTTITGMSLSVAVFADHASASFETGAAGAIMTTPGATLPKGMFVLGASIRFIDFDDIPDATLEAFGAADKDVHSTDNLFSYQASLAYGISDYLTVGASVPYLDRNNIRAAHNDMGMGEVEAAGDAAGIGDVRFFGQYRFYHDRQQDMAVLGGIKAPTGTTGERENAGELFETDHQPGSGSWDPFFGLAYNLSFGRAGFSSNVLYSYSTEGSQDTELGNVFNYNVALSYRLFSAAEPDHQHHQEHDEHSRDDHVHSAPILDYVDVVLELNGDVRGRDKFSGNNEENSGGHILYLSPGMRAGIAKNWSLYTSVGIPVVKNLNGDQSEPGYRIIGGFSVLF